MIPNRRMSMNEGLRGTSCTALCHIRMLDKPCTKDYCCLDVKCICTAGWRHKELS